jgi:hypothetical protein
VVGSYCNTIRKLSKLGTILVSYDCSLKQTTTNYDSNNRNLFSGQQPEIKVVVSCTLVSLEKKLFLPLQLLVALEVTPVSALSSHGFLSFFLLCVSLVRTPVIGFKAHPAGPG